MRNIPQLHSPVWILSVTFVTDPVGPFASRPRSLIDVSWSNLSCPRSRNTFPCTGVSKPTSLILGKPVSYILDSKSSSWLHRLLVFFTWCNGLRSLTHFLRRLYRSTVLKTTLERYFRRLHHPTDRWTWFLSKDPRSCGRVTRQALEDLKESWTMKVNIQLHCSKCQSSDLHGLSLHWFLYHWFCYLGHWLPYVQPLPESCLPELLLPTRLVSQITWRLQSNGIIIPSLSMISASFYSKSLYIPTINCYSCIYKLWRIPRLPYPRPRLMVGHIPKDEGRWPKWSQVRMEILFSEPLIEKQLGCLVFIFTVSWNLAVPPLLPLKALSRGSLQPISERFGFQWLAQPSNIIWRCKGRRIVYCPSTWYVNPFDTKNPILLVFQVPMYVWYLTAIYLNAKIL